MAIDFALDGLGDRLTGDSGGSLADDVDLTDLSGPKFVGNRWRHR